MNTYHKNIESLRECTLQEHDIIEELTKFKYDNEYIYEKKNILYLKKGESEYQLESKNGEKEAKMLLKDIDWNKENLIFVLGIGNRTLLRKLASKISSGSKIIIYEPNREILKYILEKEDLTELLVPGKVLIWWKEQGEGTQREYGYDILALNWAKLAYNIQIITCPAYHVYMEEFKQLFKGVKTKVFQYFMSLGNSLEDVLQGFQQNAENLLPCMETNSIVEIYKKYQGYPAIIVAAGPSLEKNIEYLKQAQGKALIISCDASWEACKSHGVKPDAIASIERGVETYQYYYENKKFDEDLVLLAPSLVWSEIYKKYPGKKIVLSKNDDGVDGWWNQFFPNLRFIHTGMSCATLAYAVAEIAGCNPIILIGQDLAYTDNKKHSSFTHTEFEGENNAEESDGLLVEDINGNMIPTDKFYNLFRYWFEDKATANTEVQLIDATEGGAKIKGSTIMTLEEAIEKYCTKEKEKSLYEYLDDISITKEQVREKSEEIIKAADKMIRMLYKVKKKTEDHYATLEKLYERIDGNTPKNQLVNIVKKMQKGDQIVNYIINQRDIITFFQQYITQTITHVKAIGNELTATNVLQNLYVQGNLMGALKRVSVMLADECEKLKETVQREAQNYIENQEE